MKEQKKDGKALYSVRYFDELPSTNAYAKRLAAEGAAEGTVGLTVPSFPRGAVGFTPVLFCAPRLTPPSPPSLPWRRRWR